MSLKKELENVFKALKEKEAKTDVDEEMNQIMKNNTWVFDLSHEACKPIRLKGVFKVKRVSTRQIMKHKARIIMKGYSQRYGLDYIDMFAPMIRLNTIRVLSAFSA